MMTSHGWYVLYGLAAIAVAIALAGAGVGLLAAWVIGWPWYVAGPGGAALAFVVAVVYKRWLD